MTSGDKEARLIWDIIFSDSDKAAKTGGRYFYSLALERIRPRDTICDAGCGYTFYLHDLMRKCGPDGSFIGIDFSSVALAKSIKLTNEYPHAHLALADILHLPIPDNSVDRVFCSETLPYLLEDVEQAINELARVAKQEVIFSLHTRGTYEIKGTPTEFRDNIVIEHKPGAKPPRRIFAEEEITKLVENSSGLKIEIMQPLRWGEIYEVPDDREWPWFLPCRERIALYYITAIKN